MLVHAAAGGVGQLLTRIAKLRGGRVIGTVSTEAKAQVARAAGADDTLRYDDFPARVRRLTGGAGVAAVYYVTRPSVVHYTATAVELRGRTHDLFNWLARGEVQVHIGGRFPVAQVRQAFTALESRQTTGKLLLVH